MPFDKKLVVLLKIASGIAIFIALVSWVHFTVGWDHILALLGLITIRDLLIVTAGIMLSHVLRVVRLIICYRNLNSSFSNIAGIGFIHNCLNFWLPMRLGELALPILSKSALDIGYRDSTVTLVFLRLLDVHVLLLLVTYFVGGTLLKEHFLWLTLACLAGLPIVLITQDFWVRRVPMLRHVRAITGSAAHWLTSYAITVAVWLSKLGALSYLTLILSDIEFNHTWVAIILADATSISPITGLANAGTFEAGFMVPLWLLGYDHSTTLSVAVSVHIVLGTVSLVMGTTGILLIIKHLRWNGRGNRSRELS